MSRFWSFWGKGFVNFDEKNLKHTDLVPVQIELVPGFGLLPGPRRSLVFSYSILPSDIGF
jgi:hypothetical protein